MLAFLATDKANRSTLRIIDADGANLTTLAPVAYYATPMWGPDSKQLLYFDLVGGKPVLFNIPTTGGKGIPFRPDSRIVAACYSPDGRQIAALIEQENGMSDLYVLPPFGIGGRAILRNIVGAKALNWRKPDVIILNASKANGQTGRAFWTVSPFGGGLKGVTGYAEPRQVSYFSVQKCDLTPYVPAVVVPVAPPETTSPVAVPIEQPEETPQPPDIADQIAMHAVAITAPLNGAVVQGAVPVKIIARKNVASISITVNGDFAFTSSTEGTEPVPKITFNWDTQEFKGTVADGELPKSYQETLRYPDGAYTICVQALDVGKKVIDQFSVTLTVRNELPAGALPGDTASMHYQYAMQGGLEYYRIHGDGTLIGAAHRQADELNATLDAACRRTLSKPLTNGRYLFRTEVRGPRGRPALSFGQYQAELPESAMMGYYALTPQGDITIEGTPGEQAFLPLTELAVPVPDAPTRLGASWEKPMWIVADLLDREATRVNATHTAEALEWVDGKRALRIRSEFRLEDGLILHTMSATTVPGLRGTRVTPAAQPPVAGAAADKKTNIGAINVWKAIGVRYAWFDLEGHRLLKADDRILYTILRRDLPAPTGNAPAAGQGQGAAVWYLVHYQYLPMPGPKKR